MKKIIIVISFIVSFNTLSQELRPREREFRIDTTRLGEPKNEFVLPEFVITGRETIEVEIGQKIGIIDVNLPQVDLNLYKISSAEKLTPDVSVKIPKSDYVKFSEKNPVAKFKAGVGRYLTTYFDGMLQGNVTRIFSISSNFYHRSSQGFIENADYVRNQFSVNAGLYLPKIKGKIFNWLGGAKISTAVNYSTYSFGFYGSTSSSFHRNMNKFNLGLYIESPYAFDYDLKLNYSIFTLLDTIAIYESSNFDGKEKRFDLSFNYKHKVDFLKLRFGVDYTSLPMSYLKGGIFAGNLLEFFEIEGKYVLDFGVKLFSFQNYDLVNKFRIYPDVSFKYLAGKKTQIYAFFAPEILNLTVSNHLSVNRFLTKNLKVAHPEKYFNLGFGVKHGASSFGIDVGLNFKAFKDFPIYVDEDKDGFYAIEFERVQFIELKGSGYLNYQGNELIFGAVLNSSYNARNRKPVPYYPGFSANLGYRYRFAFGLVINLEIDLISSRVYNFSGDELKGFALVNLGAEYEVFKNFKVFLNLDNLLSQKFYNWHNYLEPNMVFVGGIEYRF
ncbi:MAG: TonB-dependent receptor domain-containing protein [Candidatus Kryptonium sp.]